MPGLFDAIFNAMPGSTEDEKRQSLANSLMQAGGAIYEASQGQPGMGRPGLGSAIVAGAKGFGQGMQGSRQNMLAQREAAIKQQMQALQMQAMQQAHDLQQRQLAAQERFVSNPQDMAAMAAAYPELAAKAAYERQMFPYELSKAAAMAGARANAPMSPLQQAQLDMVRGKIETANQEKQMQNQNAIGSIESTISAADEILSHPGFNAAVGKSSYIPSVRGSNAYDFERKLESFKAQTFIPMVSALKGMGALSDAEGKKLEAAVGALDLGMGEDAFKKEMSRIKGDLTSKLENYRQRVGKSSQNDAKIDEALAALGMGGM